MKNKRIFAFDFIRAIAVFSIVLIHYNALYFFGTLQRPDLIIGCKNFGGIYLGAWGVALFFILSGASLMHVYQGKYKISTFYKKRFLGIFPMFWIAWLLGLLVLYAAKGCYPFYGTPLINFIFTLIGIDGTVMTIIPTFYILGEWFLGCIIGLYLVFPLLKLGVEKKPIITGIIVAGIFFYMIFFYNFAMPKNVVFLTHLPEMYFGMIFVKYFNKVKLPVAILGAVVLPVNHLIRPEFIPGEIQALYVGITSFLLLFYIAKWFEKVKPIKCLCDFLSKYSYAIFLTHHIIIIQVSALFNIQNFGKIDSLCLFGLCCVLTLIASVLLFKLEKSIVKAFRPLLTKNDK